jgi:predicted O-methyltransferase YrrM
VLSPTRDIFAAFPGIESVEVDLGPSRYTPNNLDPFERHALAAICLLRRPARIFEIGTFDGDTTRVLARNAPGAEIFTLDLPVSEVSGATEEAERANVAAGGVGARFRGRPESGQITQLLGDSRLFDFSPWFGSIDLVVVDAGHEWDAVSADTATAARLLAPGGIIVWDDYMPYWPAVVRAVDECPLSTFHLARSDFAIHDSAASPHVT